MWCQPLTSSGRLKLVSQADQSPAVAINIKINNRLKRLLVRSAMASPILALALASIILGAYDLVIDNLEYFIDDVVAQGFGRAVESDLTIGQSNDPRGILLGQIQMITVADLNSARMVQKRLPLRQRKKESPLLSSQNIQFNFFQNNLICGLINKVG